MSFVHHLCIQTNDYAASLAFYHQLGFILKKETPDFHGRAYNSWLQLGDFYLELQTGKYPLSNHVNANYTGIVHFCLWVGNLTEFIAERKLPAEIFLKKSGEIIYTVENEDLCKLVAPEGTIVELRDNHGI